VPTLRRLAEPDLGLIRKLFWDGLCEDELAHEWRVGHQAVNKRKLSMLIALRRKVGVPCGQEHDNSRDFRRKVVADWTEAAFQYVSGGDPENAEYLVASRRRAEIGVGSLSRKPIPIPAFA
jgi:hypothetical protein